MLFSHARVALGALTALLSATVVTALGSSCSSPLGTGNAGAGDPYWQQTIQRQGTSMPLPKYLTRVSGLISFLGLAPYSSNPSSYSVFRNVKVRDRRAYLPDAWLTKSQNYGAKGDGVTDDTAAIKYAQLHYHMALC
jgi:glucan 1,3-beta-glucosidase